MSVGVSVGWLAYKTVVVAGSVVVVGHSRSLGGGALIEWVPSTAVATSVVASVDCCVTLSRMAVAVVSATSSVVFEVSASVGP